MTNNALGIEGSTEQVSVSGTAFSSTRSTTTTVTVSPTSSTFGELLTFAATVSAEVPSARPQPGGLSTPTGTVTFTDLTTSATLASNVSLSSRVATFSLSTLGVGSHTIQAAYTPTNNFSASSGTVSVTVSAAAKAATSLVYLTSSANPSALGQAVTFTAAVSGQPASDGMVTGTVQFSDGATLLASVSLSNGPAVFTTSALGGGSHNIIARYSGNGTFPPSEATVQQIVNAAVTVTISASPTAPVFGQAIVFVASVSAKAAPGAAAPTGHVTWVDPVSGVQLGTAPLSLGTATLSLNSLAVGPHTISVLYSGDANWSYAAGTLTVTVSQAASSSAVSIAMVDGQLMLMANVAAVAPGAGTPTGGVKFMDVAKNTIVATASLSSGTGSASIATGAAADVLARPIAAVYSGDAGFTGSASAPPACTGECSLELFRQLCAGRNRKPLRHRRTARRYYGHAAADHFIERGDGDHHG